MARAKDDANGVGEGAPPSDPEPSEPGAAKAVGDALSDREPAARGPEEAERSSDSEDRGVSGGKRPPTASDRHRLLALGIAAVVLFPVLAKSGIWDPYELDTGDLARRIALQVFHAKGLDLPGGVNVLPTLTDLKMGELPFTSMAAGFKLFGFHDWTGRLPLAVWGFAGVAVLYETLARLVDRRAGLYAAVALVTMPLYFMQARTMLGDIVTMSALTIAFCGLLNALLEARHRAVWLGVGAVGLAAGYLSRGLILGVAVPALSVGLAWLALRWGQDDDGDEAPSFEGDLAGGLSLVIGVVALGMGIRALFRVGPDSPLARSVGFLILRRPGGDATFDLVVRQLGHALFPWSAFLPFALGRLLRAPVEAPAAARAREAGVRVALLVGSAVAYGAFALLAPKSGTLAFSAPALLAAAAGICVLDFERGAPHSRTLATGSALLGAVLFADIYRDPDKALAALAVDKPQFPKSFETGVEGLPAFLGALLQQRLGLGIGQVLLIVVWLAFVGLTALAWFETQPSERTPPLPEWAQRMARTYQDGVAELGRIWNGNLVFGMVVVEAALVGLGAMIYIGRRVGWAPVDRLPKNFADTGVNVWWVVPLVLAALPLVIFGVRDAFRAIVHGTRLSRASFTLVAALISGGTLSFGYYPGLSAQLSPKEGFDAYAHLSNPGEPLGLLGVRSRAAAYYGGGEAPSFTDAAQAFAWLTERPQERRWLLLKADDLPRTNSLFRTQYGKNLPILDGRSSQILLASNQLGDHPNESWIAKLVLDDPPHPAQPLEVVFEDQLATIGWEVTDKRGNLMETVVPATKYHLRVYYKVLKPINGAWKAFVHIDGFQRRFNGDHNVLDGRYAMNLWRPGDVIVDDFEFQLEPNFTPGGYTLYFGFFTGETRFKVTKGQNHENRAIAGVLNVR
jgi:hypothetical protein